MISMMIDSNYEVDDSGYLLVVHGSRNLLYGQQLQDLLRIIRQRLSLLGFSCLIETAYLELGKQSLSDKIVEFGRELRQKDCQCLRILPLFLLSGTHVVQDIPTEVEIARQYCSIDIKIMPHLGKSCYLVSFLKTEYEKWGEGSRILFCHGTSLRGGNEEIESLGSKIQARIAYWAIAPSLKTIITELASFQPPRIVILPYFLFQGKIIDAIAAQVAELQKEINCELILLSPLKEIEGLSDLIVDSLLKDCNHKKVVTEERQKIDT